MHPRSLGALLLAAGIAQAQSAPAPAANDAPLPPLDHFNTSLVDTSVQPCGRASVRCVACRAGQPMVHANACRVW